MDPVGLTPLEARLLAFLELHRGEFVPRERLQAEVWEYAASVTTRTIDVTVSRLRAKLPEPERALLRTLHGEGYQLAWPEAHRRAACELRGRRRELDALLGWARGRDPGWLTVAGPCGVGKSALLDRLHAELDAAEPCGAVRVDRWDGLFRTLEALARPTLLLLDLQARRPSAPPGVYDLVASRPVRVVCVARSVLGLRGEAALVPGPLQEAAVVGWLADAGVAGEDAREVVARAHGLPAVVASWLGVVLEDRHRSLDTCARATAEHLSPSAASALARGELTGCGEEVVDELLRFGLATFAADGPALTPLGRALGGAPAPSARA